MESARRSDFPGEGLWRELGLAFHRNVTPALRQVCVECRQRGVRTHTRLPAELRVLHRSALLAPDPVCSALIRERPLTGVCFGANVVSFKQPIITFLSEELLSAGHGSRLKQFTLVIL